MALTKTPIELSSTPSIVDGGNATAITIDSSENVLVGKTANDNTTAGHRFTASGFTAHVVANDYPLLLNRLSSDGALLTFRKDSTTVGSIGAVASQLYIAGGDTGFQLNGTADQIRPCDGSGAARDAAIDLGDTTRRFKDLYLSGGAYLGGTAAANKLDDYEEGTWTPTVSSGTVTAGTSYYTKVGRLVTVNTILGTWSDFTSTTVVSIQSLPFPANASDQAAVTGCLAANVSTIGSITGGYFPGTGNLYLYNTSAGVFTNLKHNHLSNSTSIYLAFTYFTSA